MIDLSLASPAFERTTATVTGPPICPSPKIWFFLSSVDAGGITTYSEHSVRCLRDRGIDSRLVIYHDESTPYTVKSPQRINGSLDYLVVRYDSRDRNVVSVQRLLPQLPLSSGDIVIGDGWRLLPFIVAAGPDLLIHVQVRHDSSAFNISQTESLVQRCAAFLCLSNWVADRLRAYCREYGIQVPIHVVEPGIPVPISQDMRATRDSGPIKLAFVGRVTEADKRYSDLIAILYELRDRLENFELHIFGSGEELSALRDLATKRGVAQACRFHGWVHRDELASRLADCDVLISTSHSEGFLFSMIEGMASGLTPVVTAVGGAPACIVDGQNGFLFSPGDIEIAADRLRRLAADRLLLTTLRAAAMKTARERFTLAAYGERLAARLLAIRESVLSGAFSPLSHSGHSSLLDRFGLPNWAVRAVRQIHRYLRGRPIDAGPIPPPRVQSTNSSDMSKSSTLQIGRSSESTD